MPNQPTDTNLAPPGGDTQRAENYIKQLIQLLSENKLIVTHTDLTQYDPSNLQDHYRIDVQNYQLEVSHSKQPNTGKDTYVLLFINSPSLDDFYNAHGIIAYLVLNDDQFKRFKAIADEQIETRRKVEEEKRFANAVKPIEQLLEKISKGELDVSHPQTETTPAPAPSPVPKLFETAHETTTESDDKKEEKKEVEEKKDEDEASASNIVIDPEDQNQMTTSDKEEKSDPKEVTIKTIEAETPTKSSLSPTLEDVQKALQQASKATPSIDREPNPDIPRVETLPADDNTQVTPAQTDPTSSSSLTQAEAPKIEPISTSLSPMNETTLPTPLEPLSEPKPVTTPPVNRITPLVETISAPTALTEPLSAGPSSTPPTTTAEPVPTFIFPTPAPASPIETQPANPSPALPPASTMEPTSLLPKFETMSQNILTSATPTGSEAPAPTGIDQAIDQAFHTSSNNSITTSTPPIGIN